MDTMAIRKAALLARNAGDIESADALDDFAAEMESESEESAGETETGRTDSVSPAEIAKAEVAVIKATADAEIAVMQASAELGAESEESTGAKTESADDSNDYAPKMEHWFYRPLR
jgi:hypothetical protein